jgi:hypothetical protein
MSILLLIKAESFHEAKTAARQRHVPIHDLAKNGGNLNEFRARTEEAHALNVQRWFFEAGECRPGLGYPPGTLLFYRLTN